MKKITLFLSMLAITSIAIAQTTQPCPTMFKRSNGAGGGCTFGRLTLIYATCPTEALAIDSVYQSGVRIYTTFGPGVIDCSGSQYQVNYCISENIAPTGFLTIYFHSGVAFNSNTCQVPGGGPAPVSLSSFYANRKNADVSVTWKSENETNSKEYIVQRKTTGDWIDVATVASANSANGSSYSYVDNNSNKGISQYRLKMVDFDASFTNSEIRTVKGNGTVSDFTVFPNPSTGNAKVTVMDISEPTDIQLVDNSGRILKNVSMNNNNTVELPNLQKGMYMIRIVNKTTGESLTKKLTVVN
jgi:hypothetical protein